MQTSRVHTVRPRISREIKNVVYAPAYTVRACWRGVLLNEIKTCRRVFDFFFFLGFANWHRSSFRRLFNRGEAPSRLLYFNTVFGHDRFPRRSYDCSGACACAYRHDVRVHEMFTIRSRTRFGAGRTRESECDVSIKKHADRCDRRVSLRTRRSRRFFAVVKTDLM